jgi:hypothetical protein
MNLVAVGASAADILTTTRAANDSRNAEQCDDFQFRTHGISFLQRI